MKPLTIAEFCDLHDACDEGREWALENCTSMQHAWETLRPEWLIWVATQEGVLTDRELRSFAVWSARQVQHLMTDKRSIAALDVAERNANGEATDAELAAAWAAAKAAALEEASPAAAAAATAAAGYEAKYAARAAAADAAWAAAFEAAVAKDAAKDAARAAQAEWLRKNTKPNFGGAG